jgi:hypothetical protein
METREAAFHLVVLADLLPGRAPASRAYAVDQDSLDEFLREAAPEAAGLVFKDFKDFRPERLSRHVPSAAKAPESRPAAPPQPGCHDPSGLDRDNPAPAGGGIFDLVAEGPAPEAPRRAVDDLIRAVVGPGTAPAAPAPLPDADRLRALRRAIGPLEAAWLGLRFLVRSLDFRAGCRLHVVPTPDPARSFRDVVGPLADDLRSQGGTACVLIDADVAGDEPWLRALLDEAAPRSIPVIASGRELRGKNPWLAVATNRFLLRPAAEGDGEADLRFGRPGWFLAALVAGAFARTGWAIDFAGRQAAGFLEGLPTRRTGDVEIPLETDLSEPAARKLEDAGLIPLVAGRNTDRAFAAVGGPLRAALFAAQIASKVEPLVSYLDVTHSLPELARTLGAGLQLLGMTPSGPEYAVETAPLEAPPRIAVAVRPAGPVLRGLPALRFEVPVPLH